METQLNLRRLALIPVVTQATRCNGPFPSVTNQRTLVD